MTTQTHRKTIAAAAVIGALAIAAPASASVLEPVSTGHYSTSANQGKAAQVQTINATYQPQQPQQNSAPVQTVNATYQPKSPTLIAATSEHPFSGQGGTELSGGPQLAALRRDGSKAEPFVANVDSTPTASASGDGFDWGDAAIGAGVSLLAAAFLMMSAGGLGGRRTSSRPKTGGAVSQGA